MSFRIFTCNDFKGHWPVGSAAVVVAPTEEIAMRMLLDRLKREGLPQDPDKVTLQELSTERAGVVVLVDGEY